MWLVVESVNSQMLSLKPNSKFQNFNQISQLWPNFASQKSPTHPEACGACFISCHVTVDLDWLQHSSRNHLIRVWGFWLKASKVRAGDTEISSDMRLERNIGTDSRGKKHQADIFIIIHSIASRAWNKNCYNGRRPWVARGAGSLLWDLGNWFPS